MIFKPFIYERQQALIVAKWTVGIRNYLLPFGVAPFAVVLAYEFLRRGLRIALPVIRYSIVHLCAAALYLMLILFIYYRVASVSKTFEEARFSVSFDGGSVVVRRGDTDVFRVLEEDIQTVYYGDRMLRIGSAYGNFCLPRTVVPETFLPARKQRGIPVLYCRWM